MAAAVRSQRRPFFGGPATLLKGVLVVLAFAGVLSGWPAPVRLALYSAGPALIDY